MSLASGLAALLMYVHPVSAPAITGAVLIGAGCLITFGSL